MPQPPCKCPPLCGSPRWHPSTAANLQSQLGCGALNPSLDLEKQQEPSLPPLPLLSGAFWDEFSRLLGIQRLIQTREVDEGETTSTDAKSTWAGGFPVGTIQATSSRPPSSDPSVPLPRPRFCLLSGSNLYVVLYLLERTSIS